MQLFGGYQQIKGRSLSLRAVTFLVLVQKWPQTAARRIRRVPLQAGLARRARVSAQPMARRKAFGQLTRIQVDHAIGEPSFLRDQLTHGLRIELP